MARPCKSAAVLTDYSQTKAETEFRLKQEEKLRGDGEIIEPEYLNERQSQIFNAIKDGMVEAGVLGSLDVYVLTECAIAIDRMQTIEEMVNENSDLLFDGKLMATKEKYTRAFCRYTNELSLSPQSRAKLANIKLDAAQKEGDPLLAIFKDRGDGSEPSL